MRTVAIGCRTIEDEINAVVKVLPECCPIYWIESGLHNYPVILKKRIQEEIDKISGVDNIVLIFGYCGNSVEGLVAQHAQLIVPKVEDCISLLLGGDQIRQDLSRKIRSYFLTDGWLRYENNIYYEYGQCVQKYGLSKAQRIFKVMLGNYSALNYIDTGTYDLVKTMEKTSELAGIFNLEQKVIPGDLHLIAKALQEEWDHDFLKVPPGTPLKINNYHADP